MFTKNTFYAASLAVFLLAGCATHDTMKAAEAPAPVAPVDTPATPAPVAETVAPAAAITPIVAPSPDIIALANKMLAHRLTLWHMATSSYQFFVGEQVSAQFNPKDKTLAISKPSSDVSCTFDQNNRVVTAKTTAGSEQTCNDLAAQLQQLVTAEE